VSTTNICGWELCLFFSDVKSKLEAITLGTQFQKFGNDQAIMYIPTICTYNQNTINH
jgi:hypothetical protein